MQYIVVAFASAKTAGANVAGLPAIARAIREASLASKMVTGKPKILLSICNNDLDSKWCQSEITRLVPEWDKADVLRDDLQSDADILFVTGEYLYDSETIMTALSSKNIGSSQRGFSNSIDDIMAVYADDGIKGLLARSNKASKTVLRSTIKPTDGIVSRNINRPISMWISNILLKNRNVRPIHATAMTAFVALLMFLCFLNGSYIGMIIGALLFQTASMLDGVDGEIARATFRSSDLGASLDSITDAVTNLAFITGLGISLFYQGIGYAFILALLGSVCLGLGMFLLGKQAKALGEHVNFDGLKHIVRHYKSPYAEWLIWITMRDFLALASAIMVVLGLGLVFLQIFSVGAFIWLLVAIFNITKAKQK